MVPIKLKIQTIAWFILLAFYAGCGDDDSKESTTPPLEATYDSLYLNVFESCSANGNCHSTGTTPDDGPDFQVDQASFYNLIVGVKVSAFPEWIVGSGCEQVELVKTSSANSSLVAGALIKSVFDNFQEGCTPAYSNHSQVAKVELTGEKAAALIKWIDNGAQK